MSIAAETKTISARRQASERVDALDGLRAIAVTWVAFYHYFHFWTPAGRGENLTAYGDAFADMPLISVGFLGIDLFFIVSGFVILLTLEKTQNFTEFAFKRAIRLWPPLLLFGTLTFCVVHLAGPEELKVSFAEYVFSILILPPQHVGMVLGQQGWQWLDGAYWSLWVEVKFYALIGLFFYSRPQSAIIFWICFEIFTIGLGIAEFFTKSYVIGLANGFFFQPYVPYFSFGIVAYLASTGRANGQAAVLAIVAICHFGALIGSDIYRYLGTELEGYILQTALAKIFTVTAFYVLIWRGVRLSALEAPLITRIGRASYGIYLMHQNLGLTILAMPIFAAAIPGMLAAVGTYALIVMIAILSYELFEKPLQSYLKRRIGLNRSLVTAIQQKGA